MSDGEVKEIFKLSDVFERTHTHIMSDGCLHATRQTDRQTLGGQHNTLSRSLAHGTPLGALSQLLTMAVSKALPRLSAIGPQTLSLNDCPTSNALTPITFSSPYTITFTITRNPTIFLFR